MFTLSETAILSTAYLPNIQYVSKILCHKQVLIDTYETYQKQSYRNRTTILGANGPLDLTIPVVKPSGNRTLTKDVMIEYETNWQKLHWKAIVSAYGHSPFFEYFEAELAPLFEKNIKYLIDFNHLVLQQLFTSLGVELKIVFTDQFIIPETEKYDFRNSIHPKPRLQREDIHFNPMPYFQVFARKHPFVYNLSFIDLMFNEGSQALDLCRKYLVKE